MGGATAMEYFLKKLLGHEIFRSMVSWSMEFFWKILKQSGPASYILNVRSLISENDCSRVALVVGMTKSNIKVLARKFKVLFAFKS